MPPLHPASVSGCAHCPCRDSRVGWGLHWLRTSVSPRRGTVCHLPAPWHARLCTQPGVMLACLAAAGLHYSLLSAVICYAPSPRGHGRLFSSPGFSPGASQMPSTHGTKHGESLGYLTGRTQACPRGAGVRSLPEVGLGVWCLLLSLILIFLRFFFFSVPC